MRRKYLMIVLSFALLASSSMLLRAQTPGLVSVRDTASVGSFPLIASGNVTTLVVDSLDAEVVTIVANALSGDIKLITGIQPRVAHQVISTSMPVIIGTLGTSRLIDSLATAGKITAANVAGKWETFCLSVVQNPFPGVDEALVIFGSDPRGTAYGVFELSRLMGVSPMVWWADVNPKVRSSLYISAGESIIGPPSVKFRGIFLNDEDWGLNPWASKKMDTDIQDIGPKTYEKIFEMLLRLKANYVWPAMHPCTKAFWYYPANPVMARRYQIVMGSSHAEPMLRNNVDEWVNNYATEYGTAPGDWNWATNSTNIKRYWTDRVVASKNQDALYTLGIRGISDSGMTGYTSDAARQAALIDVIANQRTILTTNLGRDASQVPQMFCPYKEVLTLYRLGLNLADDITLAWVDDNYGYMRQLSNPQEQLRGGGAGVYYHFSYWGSPEDYLWLSSISPSLVSFEMTKAYNLNAKKLWVFNVGDIKPAEMELQFAMDLAWDINAWSPENANLYSKQWASETFGEEFGDSIGYIKQEYYRLAASGKPEHLQLLTFTDQEIAQRLTDFANLVAASKRVGLLIPARLKDAYFQLIGYPVEAAASMNVKILSARQSLNLAAQGNQGALTFSANALSAYQNILSLTTNYNTGIAGGKWNGIMNYAPRQRPQFYQPTVATAATISQDGIPSIAGDTVTVITADKFAAQNGAGYTFKTIKGLGVGGSSLTVLPLNMTTYTQANITTAPYSEYNIPVAAGANTILVKCLPTFPLYSGLSLRYAISVDNATPVFINIANEAETTAWSTNVLNGYAGGSIAYQSTVAKVIKVRIYFSDPGLVVSTINAIIPTPVYIDPHTSLITNPSFEYKAAGVLNDGSVVRGTPYGWKQTGTVVGNSFGINNDATNFDGANMCWYNVNQSPYAMPARFELYQTIKNMQAGAYVIRCRMAVLSGGTTNERLFANNAVQYYGNASSYVSNLTAGEKNTFAGWTPAASLTKATLCEMAVKVILNQGDSLKLGIRSSNLKSDGTIATGTSSSMVYGGFKVDYFRLERYDVPAGLSNIEKTDVCVVGLDKGIKVDINNGLNNANVTLYSLVGNLISNTRITCNNTTIAVSIPGVYIAKVINNGTETINKVIVW